MITQSQLKELLNYSPDTGVFTWLEQRGKMGKGTRAGAIRTQGNNGKKYRALTLDRKWYQEHRMAWLYVTGALPSGALDYINGNGADNRFCNLREVCAEDNQRNTRLNKRNKSGVMGVVVVEEGVKYRARIGGKKSYSYLGMFTDKFEAICARKSAEASLGYHANHGSIRSL